MQANDMILGTYDPSAADSARRLTKALPTHLYVYPIVARSSKARDDRSGATKWATSSLRAACDDGHRRGTSREVVGMEGTCCGMVGRVMGNKC